MSETTLYEDRINAGEALAQAVETSLEGNDLPVRVYALPRGGVPVAIPIAQRLNCPLEVLAAKKISLPPNSELALGAVTPDGTTVWAKFPQVRQQRKRKLDQGREKAISSAIAQQEQFQPYCPSASVAGSIVMIVDDGIATGMTMMSAIAALRNQNPAQIWVVAPVAPPETEVQFQKLSDHTIILHTPDPFLNVGRFYKNFPQVSTEEAVSLLLEHQNRS